ncbi:MAG: M23 family metallopeptidase [Candidatus Sungiibacteriota bacterium]
MRTIPFLLVLAFIAGAALSGAWMFSANKFGQVARMPETPQTTKSPELVLATTEPEQGDTLIFRINGTNTPSATATFGSNPVALFSFRAALVGIIGIDAKARTGVSTLLIKLPSGQDFRRDIIVGPRAFPVVKLILPPQLVEKGVTAEKLAFSITAKDKPTLDAVFKIFTPEIYFSQPFQEPLKRWTDVGGFGVVRESQSGGIRHLGVDLKGALGETVAATNDGVVRFSGELENFGKTVAVDHGMGIFSAYLHLSEILVKSGQPVKKGEIIGRVGSSGEYSIEPHLHFSIKIRGSSVDPQRFLNATSKFLQ